MVSEERERERGGREGGGGEVGLGGRRKKEVCWVVKWGLGFGKIGRAHV